MRLCRGFIKIYFSAVSLLLQSISFAQVTPIAPKEKTAFQTSSPWIPEIDVRSDIAIVYGAGDRPGLSFEQRVKSWRDRGYQTNFMTGIAWGGYENYFLGTWDGKNHFSDGQVTRNGDTIWHGHNVPYIVPSASFIEYMKTAVIKKVIDAGITSIFLEEPEFWARAGYSAGFKAEWQKYYGSPWKPQHESAENTYLSNKLKYHLYYNAIKEVSAYAKQYGKRKGLNVKVFIPTHSLVNYSSWQIVSPEASLASLPGIDGYIAQVWTGTSREPIFYNGKVKERVFENAFLEYGSMVSMTAPTKRKLFFLTDPIEDRQKDWQDYKQNYQATFTAKLLYPMVADYEVMPWPERIYTHPYKIAGTNQSTLIPRPYSTQMQIMVNALNNMPLTKNKISGSGGIGVLMCNSLMFQRFPTHNGFEDPRFSNFYGQTFPLLKAGVPVETVHLENLAYPETLKGIKVLILSYSNMKPMNADMHRYLAEWVKKGGVLVYCGRDNDPYQNVTEWWNTNGNHFKTPAEQLFQLLNIQPVSDDQKFSTGKGTVYLLRKNPKEFVMEEGGSYRFTSIIREAFEKDAKAGKLVYKNNFYLQRGAYDIVSVMEESISNEPFVVKGPVIDLFDPQLPLLDKKTVQPGQQAFLYNLTRVADKKHPSVLASASRIYDELVKNNSYSFISKSPAKTTNSMRVLLPAAPKAIMLSDHTGAALKEVTKTWDAGSQTLYLSFENNPEGTTIKLSW
ncbi:hypothetical protein SAMN05444410_10931 [Hydrobacter penzbergensis]|uniref:Beta-galactosidase trimerisation domain-containing protein n=1 Tax=Hydrobacter penzbergensis TaxID=1235997 RepID=A0A8X8IGN0_9BACT|nr:hypothetical protein [Hydrobacter penzbergensis]SDX09827.1 hypothetical protein SAMN05444410_10931 [Hydrobacter penzbergensis]